ncbi:MAG: hypothetical protein IJU95_04560, partial [Treponema sp.]|nr:hypothetical protein [Treponema sp.]
MEMKLFSIKSFIAAVLALSLSLCMVFAYDFTDDDDDDDYTDEPVVTSLTSSGSSSSPVEAESLESLGALKETSSGEYSFGTYPQ